MDYLKICLLFILVQMSQQIEEKLPDNARPFHYEIKIFPPMILEAKQFVGESTISLQVFKPSTSLTLHSYNLGINQEATKLTGNGVNLIPQNHKFDNKTEFLIINFANEIQPGNYFLYLKFIGAIEDGSSPSRSGFFRKKIRNKLFLSTYFNSYQARQTFPCWDEVSIKATFTIWIKRLQTYMPMSNMPDKSSVHEVDNSKYMWTTFHKTPPLSANMVCIMVTDFHHVISNVDNTFSVTSEFESDGMAFHTLQRGINAISLFEKHIGINSSFPEIQLLGVLQQNDEPLGTCGLIIASELIEPTANYLEDDREIKPYVHMIYALARQWFGCMVTPATPADIWITEGLVLYMSHFILGKMESFSAYAEYIRYRSTFYALNIDINLYNGSTIQGSSSMNYKFKAEAVMHMISGLLTENVFHSTIKEILQTYKHKTITTDQFWTTLQNVLKKSQLPRNNFNIRMYMESYIMQKGYPIINVERDHSCNIIKLTQTSSIQSKGVVEQKWWVPINIVNSHTRNFAATFPTFWMNPHDEKLIADGLNHDVWWYLVNVQSLGLYRVNYDERNWNRIVDYLNSDAFRNIHILNRIRIVDDAFYFNEKNELPQDVMKGIERYIHTKKDLVSTMRARDFSDLYE